MVDDLQCGNSHVDSLVQPQRKSKVHTLMSGRERKREWHVEHDLSEGEMCVALATMKYETMNSSLKDSSFTLDSRIGKTCTKQVTSGRYMWVENLRPCPLVRWEKMAP